MTVTKFTDNNYRQQTLIFLHIPKTAGTTFNRILEWEYNPVYIFTIDSARITWSHNKFKQLSEIRKKKLQVLKGHMCFGFHEYSPRSCTYITFLRQPVNRILSTYFFIKDHWLHPLHGSLRRNKVLLEEFVQDNESKANLQTKLIGGVSPYEECTEKVFIQAKENLTKHFKVVGLTERFKESLLIMQQVFGWNLHGNMSFRISKSRPLKNEISNTVLETIEHYNRYDLLLYEHGKTLFNESLIRYGPFEQDELANAVQNQEQVGFIDKSLYFSQTLARAATSKIISTF